MYNKADIRIGIDSIKIRLAKDLFKKSEDEYPKIINRIMDLFKDNDNISVFYVKESKAYIIGHNNKGTFCKLQSIHNPIKIIDLNGNRIQECTIEIFGLNQAHSSNIFNLPNEHKMILEFIPKLYSPLEDLYPPRIIKIDMAFDIFYSYNKTLILYNSIYNNINKQKKDNISFINGFGTITLTIPIDDNKLISKILSNNDLKKKKSTKDSYIKYVEEIKGYMTVNYKNYRICKKNNATHLQLILKDKDIYYKYYNLISNSGTKIDYKEIDSDLDVSIKKNRRKVSIITYNKTYKDSLNEVYYDNYVDIYYKNISEIYSNNNNEYDEIYDNLNHTRTELRFYYSNSDNLDIFDNEKNLLQNTFQIIINDIKKQANKLNISIFDTHSDIKRYISDNKKINSKRKIQKSIKIKGYGKSLDSSIKDIESSLDSIKMCFKPNKKTKRKIVKLFTKK